MRAVAAVAVAAVAVLLAVAQHLKLAGLPDEESLTATHVRNFRESTEMPFVYPA